MPLKYGSSLIPPGADVEEPLKGYRQGSPGTVNVEISPKGRVAGRDGVETITVAGAVSDSDFTDTPADGTLAVDTSNNEIYVRIGGSWLSVGVA